MHPKLPTIIPFSKLEDIFFSLLIKANVVIIFIPKVQIFSPLSQRYKQTIKKKGSSLHLYSFLLSKHLWGFRNMVTLERAPPNEWSSMEIILRAESIWRMFMKVNNRPLFFFFFN